MNELDLTIRGATLDEIHEKGMDRAATYFGERWKPTLVRCDAVECVITGMGDVVLYEARMTYRGVPSGVRVSEG